ncbi:MAG TPA: Gfo/Idh/MocA family oxidoreductase [Chthoniobacteraceae bacterium]|nr:Gfo/Idh/MocA family oxidoreductase [Chthoniobacteraceae bacterium]
MTHKKDKIRLALIGVGTMGKVHAKRLLEGLAPSMELTALCDTHVREDELFSGLPFYTSVEELFARETLDAVFIATPHYLHANLGVAALEHGLHTLVEKPMAANKEGCERLLEAQKRSGKVLSVMLSMRTKPVYRKVKELLDTGALGTVRRVHWIASNWFRTQKYYASSSWRGSWKGEGGGVLLNQCPHQLDLFSWFMGQPEKVTAFCGFGRYHDIEAEDDVTAVLHYPDGMKAVFVASTGESPGTDRLEIVGEMGRLIAEGGRLHWDRNRVAMTDFSRTTETLMDRPECESFEVPLEPQKDSGHMQIFENFARAILYGEELIAPAHEGMLGVELANAMQYSTWTDSTVALPLESAAFLEKLEEIVSPAGEPSLVGA